MRNQNSPVQVTFINLINHFNGETVRQPKYTKNISQAETCHLSHIKIPNCHQRQSAWAPSISDFLSTSHSLFPPLNSLLRLLHCGCCEAPLSAFSQAGIIDVTILYTVDFPEEALCESAFIVVVVIITDLNTTDPH